MKKVILVDDERYVLESISKYVDWASADCELVSACNNAFEAIDAAAKLQPDIIITDIRMPRMNGIELVREIKGFLPDCEFIILSGYDDFSVAKSALQEGVRDYLLKPCSEEDIVNALKSVIKKQTEEKEKINSSVREELIKQHKLESNISVIEEKRKSSDFIAEVINYVDENYADEKLNIKFIAQEILYMNEDYVGRAFTKRTGKRFSEYLNEKRMSKAKVLLITTKSTVEDIALAVGYGRNPQYFTRLFKKAEGITPKEFRDSNSI